MINNGYQIIRTKDQSIIEHLVPFMKKLIDKTHEDYSIDSFLKWYRIAIQQSPLVLTWVAIKKGNRLIKSDTRLMGYAIGTISSNLEKEYFNITHLYSDDKKLTNDLLETIETWAKKNGIHTIGGVTKRSPKAWQKKYGYKVISYNMVKEI